MQIATVNDKGNTFATVYCLVFITNLDSLNEKKIIRCVGAHPLRCHRPWLNPVNPFVPSVPFYGTPNLTAFIKIIQALMG